MGVTLSSYAEAKVLGMIAVERGILLAATEISVRTYHLGTKPTLGRGYDDCLSARLGPSRPTLMAAIELWKQFGGKRGGRAHVRGGKKYWVSGQACREWLCSKLNARR
jgi:hypothetical protein